MDLVFALKWVKSVIGRALYIFHLSGLSQKVMPSIEQNIGNFNLLGICFHIQNSRHFFNKFKQTNVCAHLIVELHL